MIPLQFTIRRMMIATGVLAGLLAIYRRAGGAGIAVAAMALTVGACSWSLTRRDPRRAGRVFTISAGVANLSFAAIDVFMIGFGGDLLLFAGACYLLPVVPGAGVSWALARSRRGDAGRRARLSAWGLVIALTALPLSIVVTSWPMQMAFLASRPAFDRLADRIASGESLARPEWAGVYRVDDATRDAFTGQVALRIGADSNGNTRFVRLASPSASLVVRPPVIVTHQLGLDGRWWYEEED